jgi:hypothetical protein
MVLYSEEILLKPGIFVNAAVAESGVIEFGVKS